MIDIEVLIGGIVVERETAHLRQDTTLDQLPGDGEQGVATEDAIDHVAPLAGCHSFGDPFGFDGAQGRGLLTEYVLPDWTAAIVNGAWVFGGVAMMTASIEGSVKTASTEGSTATSWRRAKASARSAP